MKKTFTVINQIRAVTRLLLATSLLCSAPLMAQEYAEGNLASWGKFAEDNASANLFLDTVRVKEGSSSIRLETASGFGTGVRYPLAANLNANASAKSHLGFWVYAENPNAGVGGFESGFQNAQPVVTLTTSGGTLTYTPTNVLMKNNAWVYYEIPLTGDANWVRAATGTPDLADVDQIEIKSDTIEFGFKLNVDGLKFLDAPKGYVESKVLVVYYMDTNGKPKLPVNVEMVMRPLMNKTTEFYWRNSALSYLVNFDAQPVYINAAANVQDSNGFIRNDIVDADLRALGYQADQYDAVMVVSKTSGNAFYGGATVLGSTPLFSVGYWDELQDNLFVTIHEFNHVVDGIFSNMGYPKYPHAHPSDAFNLGEYVPNSGLNDDLNAKMLRYWGRDAFQLLGAGKWAESKVFEDTDNDGVPNGVDFPITEAKLGSSPNNKDADKDGLNDLQEAMAGIYGGTNPNVADTDGDGINDKLDSEPLYAVNQVVPVGTLDVNADISTWPKAVTHSFLPAGGSSDLYVGSDANYLYVGAKVQGVQPQLRLFVDPDSDGSFHGRGNLEVVLSAAGFEQNRYKVLETLPDYDGTYKGIETFHTATGFLGRRVAGSNWTSFQMAIPKSVAYNLQLLNGNKVGLGVATEVPGQISQRGSIFETFDLVPFSIAGGTNVPYMTSPLRDAFIISGGSVELTAGIHNPAGAIGKVEFYTGSVKLGEDTTTPYSVSWSGITAGDYPIVAKTWSTAGALLATSAPVVLKVIAPVNPVTVTNIQPGIDYKYYEGNWTELPDFNSLAAVKTGAQAEFSLVARNRDDQFGFRFTGYLQVPTDGVYKLYSNSDDGSRIYIGSTMVLNNDGLHAPREEINRVPVVLKAGLHPIIVDFFENGGGEQLSLMYEGPGIAKQAIPASALYRIVTCTAQQWSASQSYTGNSYVQYSGKKYRAKWWTLNERPDLNSGSYQVWESQGNCTN